jgi:hypothetical protein
MTVIDRRTLTLWISQPATVLQEAVRTIVNLTAHVELWSLGAGSGCAGRGRCRFMKPPGRWAFTPWTHMRRRRV